MKRYLFILMTLGVLLTFLFQRKQESMHMGRPLSYWLELWTCHPARTPMSPELEAANRTLRPEAIPFVLRFYKSPFSWQNPPSTNTGCPVMPDEQANSIAHVIAIAARNKDGSIRREFADQLSKPLVKALHSINPQVRYNAFLTACALPELRLIPEKELRRIAKSDDFPMNGIARTILQTGAYKREP